MKITLFGGLPEGWQRVKFGDLTTIEKGKKPASHANLLGGGGQYPFFTCSFKTKRSYTYSYDFPAFLISGGGNSIVSSTMENLRQVQIFLYLS